MIELAKVTSIYGEERLKLPEGTIIYDGTKIGFVIDGSRGIWALDLVSTAAVLTLFKERDELVARVKYLETPGAYVETDHPVSEHMRGVRRDSVEQMAMSGIEIRSLDELVCAVERVAKAIR